ncbi:hypothetical protein FJ938_01980 [Mesorhizobium sp. B2-4-14]|nr:hypothetical protein FJ548_00445 [Mesorhizobium sp. B2-4-17]TPL11520.1 hypothetical protein FJ938_01980 [Mesorhizobium sp. B2-4-14]
MLFITQPAGNHKPGGAMGLTRKQGEVEDRTLQSNGQNQRPQATPSPAIEKTSGAGPSIAEHSKDAKAG